MPTTTAPEAPDTAEKRSSQRPAADPTAEETEAAELLAKLPDQFIDDEFRSTVMANAKVIALHRRHEERHAAIEADLAGAMAAHDLDGAEGHAQRILASHHVRSVLPAGGLDPEVIERAVERAATAMQATVAFELHPPRYLQELAYYEQLPGPMRIAQQHGGRPQVEAPQSCTEDLEAMRAYRLFIERHERWKEGYWGWHRARAMAPDPFHHLQAAAGYVKAGQEYADEAEELKTLIAKANHAHLAAGIVWQSPPGFDLPGVAAL